MHVVGIDIGSTATKVMAIDKDKNRIGMAIVAKPPGTTGESEAIDALYESSALVAKDCTGIVATGYGRLISEKADREVSEISCHARGINQLLPNVRTIIDFGGQDLKAIQINDKGIVQQFLMNDKCAAGTGRFLEVMSRVMGIEVSKLGDIDAQATKEISISNTCTVFAESEVISLMSVGHEQADIVAGIHEAVARKVTGLVMRVGIVPELTITGGGALNKGLVGALEKSLNTRIWIPEIPQYTGALGAALYALEDVSKRQEKE